MTNSKSNHEESKKHHETVVFENVDIAILEYQRLALVRVAVDGMKNATISGKDLAALDGLINMLDDWSDNIYYKEMNNNLTNEKK